MKFTEQDIKNRDIIFDLVKKCFALNKKSLNRFEKNLYEPDIDEKFLKITNGELKKEFIIPIDILGNFDTSFLHFKKVFHDLIEKYNITYQNFLQNKVLVEKNEVKLIKLVEDQDQRKKLISIIENKIGYNNVEDYKFVISLDYVDWFLCSTGESWKSCLNLNNDYEGAYWSGVPGLIVDKNRCMLYVSNGQKKEYFDIIADKMIGRCWGILNENDSLSIVRWFPKEYFSGMEKLFLPMNISPEISSKHKIDFLTRTFNENEYSVFIYLDCSIFDNGYIYTDNNSGFYFYKNGDTLVKDDLFYFKGGLNGLVHKHKTLEDFALGLISCYKCGEIIDGQINEAEDYKYCESCFDKLFCYCDECGEILRIDRSFVVDRNAFCESCFLKYNFICKECGKGYELYEAVEYGGENYCPSCAEDKFITCCECGKVNLSKEIYSINDGDYCKKCYNKFTKIGEPILMMEG